MSQSHLLIDFPMKAPADAKALADELPPLMPDLAKAQDDLGTVHFSRFMVEGDEKLLFLSDIDGEGDQHIERLVEGAGPVFDAIFEHVDDPPATPVAGNPQKVVKWLKHHVREPLDAYFAYGEASVQDIKAAARAAGFTGTTTQGPLLTYMSIKSRHEALSLKLVAPRRIRDESYKASDGMSPKYRMSRSGLQPYDQPRHLDPHRRMYSTYRWQKMRARQIRRQPYCAEAGSDCAGPLTADHIVPVSEGGDPFDFANLTTRCRHHNSAKGAR